MKKVQDFKVLEYSWLNDENYILKLIADDEIPEIKPGNFAEIKVPDSADIFLRRPISVLDVNYEKKTISFYIKAIGKGTRKLGQLNIGQTVNIVYPLGNQFVVQDEKKVLIVGGGSGIAPFVLLGRELQSKDVDVTFLMGGRTKNDIFLTDEFSKYGKVEVTTEDGSRGEKGMVTHHSLFKSEFDFDKVYTCGPDPMMKAVAKIAESKGILCEASLENMMACGIGACLCCVTPTHDGNKVVCTEGPVFNTKELAW
ncbi:MAG: dihydroorotate dehydrogenase electron transfer subunit [Marinilabiliales bacterium]|nr:MAG: dihydroorotate dehydrogenase electron transfer subunit [Marinilabiliales bacterium]